MKALHTLQGTWYIHMSNFPMWLKGTRQDPSFTYTLAERKGIIGLKDEVAYYKKGKRKTILGFDKPLDQTGRRFVWRGKGLLALLSSNWEIRYAAPNGTWMLIYFQRTLFTPEGYDVIARDQSLDASLKKEIDDTLQELDIDLKLSWLTQSSAL